MAGGTGSRLYPVTQVINKQLLPLFDKPIIFYPLTTLMLAGIQEILIITTEEDIISFQKLFGNGTQWGLTIEYAIQEKPLGLPEAFIIGEKFINNEPVALILGDNIFHGQGLSTLLGSITKKISGAHLFAFSVQDPSRYGVLVVDEYGKAIDIEEKPKIPKSRYAVTGLYIYDASVVEIAYSLKPSSRGELEITDVNKIYIQRKQANVHALGRGYVWFDVGTPEAMYQATNYVHAVQTRQGVGIACPEEVAWRMGYINSTELNSIIQKLPQSQYLDYISKLLDNEIYSLV